MRRLKLLDVKGADGLVLTATILKDNRGHPVPAMPLEKIRTPVLVMHHEQTGQRRSIALLTFNDGESKDDPCEAMAYHDFNVLEREVIAQITAWILAK